MIGPWRADYGRRTGELDEQYHASLRSIGLELGDDGRMYVAAPPPCGHKPWERNHSRDQLICDGCREAR